MYRYIFIYIYIYMYIYMYVYIYIYIYIYRQYTLKYIKSGYNLHLKEKVISGKENITLSLINV